MEDSAGRHQHDGFSDLPVTCNGGKNECVVETGRLGSTLFQTPFSMEYLLIVYCDEKFWGELPESERDRIGDETDAFKADLAKKGCLRAWSPLQPVATATTVRRQRGKTVITDGPFAETREVVGGFVGVECRDLDEAVALAARFPLLEAGGSVEVRPARPV
jgi:hypothetical protein